MKPPLGDQARNVLLSHLHEVPFIQATFGRDTLPQPIVDFGFDELLHLRLPTSDVLVAVSFKSNGETGVIRQAIHQLTDWRNQFAHDWKPANLDRLTDQSLFAPKENIRNSFSEEDWRFRIQSGTNVNDALRNVQSPLAFALPYGVVIAPYIPPRAAALCRESGVGYCDFVGNCFLAFGQVYIRWENWPDPKKRTHNVSLWSPKSQRVLRVLLENPGQTWKTQTLVVEADVSSGLISNVRSQLNDREWLEEREDGFMLIKPWLLLNEWAKNYKINSEKVHSYYSLNDIPEIEGILSMWSRGKIEPHNLIALTSSSGASRVANYARYSQVMAYTMNANLVVSDLGLRPVDSGANVRLIEPYDQGIFYGLQWIDGTPVVCPTQLYLDLRASGGRGNDAAEFLLDNVMRPRWQKAIAQE